MSQIKSMYSVMHMTHIYNVMHMTHIYYIKKGCYNGQSLRFHTIPLNQYTIYLLKPLLLLINHIKQQFVHEQ